jgi:hypothetical protein
MKLNEILQEWQKDSHLDDINLDNAALSIAMLHHKYFNILSRERLLLRKKENDFKTLKLEKYEFLTDGPTQEQIDKGWKLPAKGKILRSDVNMYIDGDSDIIRANLDFAYQQEKIDLLESIIKTIGNLGFHVKSAIDFRRMQSGS